MLISISVFLIINSPVVAEPEIQVNYDSFIAYSGNMMIYGVLDVEDSITIKLSVKPQENIDLETDQILPYYNDMEIKLHKIIEYEDLNNDGLTVDDKILGITTLNSSFMDSFIHSDTDSGIIFKLPSIDSTFVVTVEVKTSNGVPVAFKWSYDLNCDLSSNSASIAVTHENVNNQNIMNKLIEDQNGDSINDQHNFLPMTFSLDNFAIIDGINQKITRSTIDEMLVINFQHGSKISYDPSISVNIKDLYVVNDIINNLLGNNVFFQPNIIALVGGTFSVGILITTGLFFDRKNKKV